MILRPQNSLTIIAGGGDLTLSLFSFLVPSHNNHSIALDNKFTVNVDRYHRSQRKRSQVKRPPPPTAMDIPGKSHLTILS